MAKANPFAKMAKKGKTPKGMTAMGNSTVAPKGKGGKKVAAKKGKNPFAKY